MANDTTKDHKIGRVVQIIGPAVDVQFDEGYLPPIYTAVRIVDDGELGKVPIDVVVEVANHIGEGQGRCIAMKPTDGMGGGPVRCAPMKPRDGMVGGMKPLALGAPISVPVGRETLGRILNVLGEPVD